MNYEKYDALASGDRLEFAFESVGPKGTFQKVIQFSPTNDPAIYNLGFGDRKEDQTLDDTIVNDNQDRDKILATVAGSVYQFTSEYPEKWVYFQGSTPQRTRLYRMALTINLTELGMDFEIFGVSEHDGEYLTEPFETGKGYSGFLIRRK